jgi:3-phosphoshikimate 1-carboxyvinyltransferase
VVLFLCRVISPFRIGRFCWVQSQRAKTRVENCLVAEDVMSTARCLQQLGVQIDGIGTPSIIVHGVGGANLKQSEEPLDCGNSGTTMRALDGHLGGTRF